MKSLKEILPNYINACFSALWIKSSEPNEVVRELAELSKAESWDLVTWDIEQGYGEENEVPIPLSAVQQIKTFGDGQKPQLVVLRHFHRFLGSIEVIQALERQIQNGKQTRTSVVVLSPVVQIPVELENLFTVVEHPFPDKEQLQKIAEGILDAKLPNDMNTQCVLDAVAGMTRMEAEDAFSLSVSKHDRLVPEPIWQLKANMLRESSALRLYRGEIPRLGGLDNLTRFCHQVLSPSTSAHGEPAKGVMLLGVSGSGKSAFAKWLGHSVQRPTLVLDIGALMGSLVGQTEAALRESLKLIDAMSPCVVMIDEVEKAMSTSGNDGGISARIFGTLLTWLNDRHSDSFVVCTANDISKLPPEFTRAERFDGIFFVDLPDKAARDQIWTIYEQHYGFEKPERPEDTDWTGAEIKACCRQAVKQNLSLKDAAQYIIPITSTASEAIHALRNWASGRCLDAARAGIYRYRQSSTRRNIRRDEPSMLTMV